MARAIAAISATVLVLALASSVHATVVTDFSQLDAIFGGQFKGHYSGGTTVSFVFTDPGTHQSPQCLSTPAAVPGDALFIMNTCNGPAVITKDDEREVSFTAGTQTVGRASDESGSLDFVSYDTTNGLIKFGSSEFSVCMRVFPDSSNGNAPVFFVLNNHNDTSELDDACDINTWLDTIHPLSASASSWCDFTNMRSVDKSVPTFSACPATGSCHIASDCITALPVDACKSYLCTDFGGTKACSSTNEMDGTRCDDSAGGFCESGTCTHYDGSTFPSFLSGGYSATPTYTYTMDSAGANPACITAATPVTASQASAAQYMQACDYSGGDMPGKIISLPQAQADTSGNLASTHPGRTYPLPPSVNWVFRHYDSSTGIMKVAMCPDGSSGPPPVCSLRCVFIADFGGNVGFIYHSLEAGSTFDTCSRSSYPANPGDMTSWNAKCTDGSAFMNGYSFASTNDCSGSSTGGGSSSSQCAMGNDIFYWQDLIISSQCDDNKYPCQPMTMPNGEPGFVLGHKNSVLGSGMPEVQKCDSCSVSLCPSS